MWADFIDYSLKYFLQHFIATFTIFFTPAATTFSPKGNLFIFSVYSEFILLIIDRVLAAGHFPSCLFKSNPVEVRPLSVCRYHESCLVLLRRPPSLLTTREKTAAPTPPSSFLLIFPFAFFLNPGKPPATVFMTHSTHLLYCCVGGLANPNNNLDPILPEHLSAESSHKESKPHTGVMLNHDGWWSLALSFRILKLLQWKLG